jgi:hypothetical protein
MQEEICSRRLVIFINDQLYFRCEKCTWNEVLTRDDRPLQDQGIQTAFNWAYKEKPDINLLNSFCTIIREYTKRTLTYQDDTFNAVAGLIRKLGIRFQSNFIEGIPFPLDSGLLFRAVRQGTFGQTLQRRIGFPSYSWTGWVGPMTWLGLESQAYMSLLWMERSTFIDWYCKHPGSQVVRYGPVQTDRPRLPTAQHIKKFNFAKYLPADSIPVVPFDLEGLTPTYPLLCFWTLSVHFLLRKCNTAHLRRPDHLVHDFDIIHESGSCHGFIALDHSNWTDNTVRRVELILMAENPMSGIRDGQINSIPDEYKKDPCYNTTIDEYWVLLVEWDGPVAERRGLGLLKSDAIDHALAPGPKWKQIVLG